MCRDCHKAFADTFPIMVHPHGFYLSMDVELGQLRLLFRRFCNGWSTFRELHGLKGGFKFILTAERRWIFDTVILDENDGEMVFDWIGPNLE